MLAKPSREWEFDLQRFAEGEEGTPPETPLEGTPPDGTTVEPEEEFEVTYNKEKVRVKKSEAPTYIQKGMNYDKVKTKADAYEIAVQKAARVQGFDSVDDYLQAIENAEKEVERKRLADAGVNDPKVIDEMIDKHPAVRQAKQLNEQQKFNSEANDLAQEFKETFGREITSQDVSEEVVNYRAQKGVSLSEAFFFVNRKSIKTMLEKEKSEAAKKALDDHKRQSTRGVESSEGAPLHEDTFDFTPDQKAWAEKRVKQGHYSSMKEAWEWLRGKKK